MKLISLIATLALIFAITMANAAPRHGPPVMLAATTAVAINVAQSDDGQTNLTSATDSALSRYTVDNDTDIKRMVRDTGVRPVPATGGAHGTNLNTYSSGALATKGV